MRYGKYQDCDIKLKQINDMIDNKYKKQNG
jgi:hypothetical protein